MDINIDCNSLRYGTYIGFKLGRLEFLWDSKFEIAKKIFVPSKEEILSQLPLTDMTINESNYKTFSQSILGYYLRTNTNVYYSILLGMAIQRSWLVGVSKNDSHNKEMQILAKSALNSIPKRIISDKEGLLEFLFKNKSMDFFEFLDKLEQFCTENKLKDNISQVHSATRKPTLFLSYTQKDAPIADIMEDRLKKATNDGIEISRYTRVPYKTSFKSFMNSIQEHDFVLCIVSGNYLQSQACMYEVGEIVKDHNFRKKLLFVVLCENDIKYYLDKKDDFLAANIYGSALNRLKYIKFWENKYKELDEELKKIDSLEATRHLSNDLYEIGKIYKNDVGTFLDYLAQNNGKNFEELHTSDFADIIDWINPELISKLFWNCKDFSQVLNIGIQEICKITGTDYNQIALGTKISSHQTGLVVFADNIPNHKQNYELVIMDGIMGKVYSTGNSININNTDKESAYFCAVEETKSELVVPILCQGNIIGVINSESEEYNHYSKTIERKIINLASDLALALNRIGYVSNMAKDKIPRIHIKY